MSLFNRLPIILALALILSACDESDMDNDEGSPTESFEQISTSPLSPENIEPSFISAHGMGVKGPLTHAIVSVYKIDSTAENFRGELIAEGITTDNAELLLDINTIHLTGGKFFFEYTLGKEMNGDTPVIPTLRTIVTTQQLLDQTPVFATPLTTLVVDYAVKTAALDNRDASLAEFDTALATAKVKVKQSFGLGILRDKINLFTSSPVLSDDTEQSDSLAYRTAIEVVAAVLDKVQQESDKNDGDLAAEDLVAVIAEDMMDDTIDGKHNGKTIAKLAAIDTTRLQEIITTAPDTLMVPGTIIAISELDQTLADEALQIAPSVIPQPISKPEPVQIAVVYHEPDADPAETWAEAEAEAWAWSWAWAQEAAEAEAVAQAAADAAAQEPQDYTVALTWTIPAQRENGSPLALSEIDRYEIYYFIEGTDEGAGQVITIPAMDNNNMPIDDHTLALTTTGQYIFSISSYDQDGVGSQVSQRISVNIL